MKELAAPFVDNVMDDLAIILALTCGDRVADEEGAQCIDDREGAGHLILTSGKEEIF